MINYPAVLGIPRVEQETLVLDFTGVDFLNTFEITELFFHCAQLEGVRSLRVRNATDVTTYLGRVNFFAQLAHLKKFPPVPQDLHTGMSNHLLELQVYTFKPEFYGEYETIFTMLQTLGLSDDAASLVLSSLAEVIDNAFSHNLGRWSEQTGPLVTVLMQDYPKKREMCLSICDFGVGFLRTLADNYPTLQNEADAVALALRTNTTGRTSRRGGNGLVYLQKNVFNGLAGDLYIRSTDTLMRVTERERTMSERSDIPFSSGANVFFRLRY